MTTDQCYSLHTGKPLVPGVDEIVTEAARLGLEPPRFCAECGRRMVVQIRPDGWTSKCSRHGSNDSALSGRR